MSEEDKIQILKDILFEEDQAYVERISNRLEELENSYNDRKKFSSKVEPIILNELHHFQTRIPETLGPTITEALKVEISKNKDQVVDALFPILGKMIKKYIAQEINKLSEKINRQLSVRGKIRSWFGGRKEKQNLVDALIPTDIEQVLLIEKKSGLLKASYSKTQTIDEEMISGMLTAIKNFVEDAFRQKGQNLEHIEYELYHIHLQSFQRYYVAVVLSGNYNLKAKSEVQDIIFNFYEDFTKNDEYESLDNSLINLQLEKNFGHAKL
ncbi:MAG: cell envelope biogenesis protein OmpA [Pricia sp.]